MNQSVPARRLFCLPLLLLFVACADSRQGSRLVIVEEMGHVPAAISNLECLDRIMLDFFAAPLAPLESGCVHDMRAPPFEVPTAAASPTVKRRPAAVAAVLAAAQ